jgi:uncharacterized protein YdiU (UPF0061 family)
VDNIFDNTYLSFPDVFYSASTPATFSKPYLIAFNKELANSLGLGKLLKYDDSRLSKIFSGQEQLPGGCYISQNYCGHQFGHFNPQLGDGRAILIGETKAPNKKDIQLKGSGPTAFSRRGDGFSELGPVLREYLVSEYMHAQGIPTTRALAACLTGDNVYRETPAPGGVFTRVASSHIRIGTFEFFSSRNQIEDLNLLLEYSIDRHYPELLQQEGDEKIITFLKAVAQKQSLMISKWMQVGFIHGVMNTDNMSISGETLDFGPCAFLDQFKKDKVFSFIDRNGRYAFNNQIQIGIWNLYQLANSLLPLMKSPSEIEKMEVALVECQKFYAFNYQKQVLKKYGLDSFAEFEKLNSLFLEFLELNNLDFTNSYRLLTDSPGDLKKIDGSEQFFELWPKDKIDLELMNEANPVAIPRNHLIEKAIQEAYRGDYSFFNQCLKNFTNPNSTQLEEFISAPTQSEAIKNTFCGT